MLTIEEATESYREWAAAHQDFVAQVNEEQALTLYLAGMRCGIELALQQMRLVPEIIIDATSSTNDGTDRVFINNSPARHRTGE